MSDDKKDDSDTPQSGYGIMGQMMSAHVAATSAMMTAGWNIHRAWMDAALTYNYNLFSTWMQNAQHVQALWNAQSREFLMNNKKFKELREKIDAEFERWDLPSPAGKAYDYSKQIFEQQLGFAPVPLMTWAKDTLMHNSKVQETLHNEGAIAGLEVMGELLPGVGELAQEQYNHKFLTENSAGEIVSISDNRIAELFPVDDGISGLKEKFPRIIITSSHARGESVRDMTAITHGIQALARDSQSMLSSDRKPLKITHVNGDISREPDHSLVLFACDTERNPFLNAGKLLRRLDDLREIAKTGESTKDDYKNVSMGAKRIARLILKCMANDPRDVPDFVPGTAKGERSIAEIFAKGGNNILLRKRPELIAQHFQLIGYSKGGNVVSDALRYLVDELQATNKTGKTVFQVQLDHGHPYSMVDERPDGTKEVSSIRNIVKNIACISIAALEVPMQERFIDAGVRRVSFNNRNDLISNHMPFEGKQHDERWIITGDEKNQGHDPRDAMGTIDDPKRNVKASSGYILADLSEQGQKVARRMKEAFAPLFGKAAVADIVAGHDEKGKECITIETSPGTTDEAFEKKIPTIKRALGDLKNLRIETEGANNRTFRIYFDNPLYAKDGKTLDPSTKKELLSGFSVLRSSKTANLVIAQEIIKKLGGPEVGISMSEHQH